MIDKKTVEDFVTECMTMMVARPNPTVYKSPLYPIHYVDDKPSVYYHYNATTNVYHVAPEVYDKLQEAYTKQLPDI